jgi:hypothetical protein
MNDERMISIGSSFIDSEFIDSTPQFTEGFGRFRTLEFARFLEFARASLMETQNHLIDGRDRRYISDAEYYRLMNLSRAALKTTTNLLRSKQRQAASHARRRHAP